MTTELPKLRMIYTGKRLLDETKMGDAFVLEATALKLHNKPDELEDAESLFGTSKMKTGAPLVIGALYEIGGTLSDDGVRAVKLATSARKGLWDEELPAMLAESVTRWKIKDSAAKEHAREASQAKKLQADKKAMHEIEYLRKVYQETPIMYRRGFETGLMALIRQKG